MPNKTRSGTTKPPYCLTCGRRDALHEIAPRVWYCESCLFAASDKQGSYIIWIMKTKSLELREAIAYATSGGQAAVDQLRKLDKHATSLKSQDIAERCKIRETARIADLPPTLRRWYNVDRPCPYRGCIYPIAHSGPHHIPSKLSRLLAGEIVEPE